MTDRWPRLAADAAGHPGTVSQTDPTGPRGDDGTRWARPEPVTPEPPRALRRRLLRQYWDDVSMAHWPVPTEQVASLLPDGCRPDTLHGRTYVGLIGFRMVKLGFGPGPGLPWLGTFLETNVRLYTVDHLGRRGVYFCSLDAQRALPVLGARLALRLPYEWSRMTLGRSGDELTYRCRRLLPRPAAQGSMTVRVGRRMTAPSELDHFLTARWGLHVRWYGGRTLYLPNRHEQWPLAAATLVHLDDDPVDGLLGRAGFAVDGDPVSVVHAPRVRVEFGPGDVLPAP